jgi:hypothetical protein
MAAMISYLTPLRVPDSDARVPDSDARVPDSPEVVTGGVYPGTVSRCWKLSLAEFCEQAKPGGLLENCRIKVDKEGNMRALSVSAESEALQIEDCRLAVDKDGNMRALPKDRDELHSSSNEARAYPLVKEEEEEDDTSTVVDTENGDGNEQDPVPQESAASDALGAAMEEEDLTDALYEADDERPRSGDKRKAESEPESEPEPDPRFEARMKRRCQRFELTCFGCIHRRETGEEMANQLAHMDEDTGCMGTRAMEADPYVSSDEE